MKKSASKVSKKSADGYVLQNEDGLFWVGGYSDCAKWSKSPSACYAAGTFHKDISSFPRNLYVGEKIVAVSISVIIKIK